MTRNFVSIRTIIESIYINAGYQTIPWNDVLEYVARIIGLINIDIGYVDKLNTDNPVEIVNYKGILPCDLIHIMGIRDLDSKEGFVYTSDIYKLNPENDYNLVQPTYFVQAGVINTNVTDCKLEISYKAIPLDEEGLPLIPDDEYYKRAIEMYVQERIDYKLWRQGKLNDKIYLDTKKEYMWAIKAAQSHCNTPSPDEVQSLVNSYNRLIVDRKTHSSGFKYNSETEKYYGGSNG